MRIPITFLAVLFLLFSSACASSERMQRMSGGVLEEYSVPKSSRLRSEKYQQVTRKLTPAKKGSRMKVAGLEDTLVNIWPFFFRNNEYTSILWPLIDSDPYGFAFRPFYNQEGDDYSILFPLAAWNTSGKSGWATLFAWKKNAFGLLPLTWQWKGENNGGYYYTPLFIYNYDNSPLQYHVKQNPHNDRISIDSTWQVKEKSLWCFPFIYGNRKQVKKKEWEWLFNYYPNWDSCNAKIYWNYYMEGKPFPATKWELEKFREKVFSLLPIEEERNYGFFPFYLGTFHDNGNYSSRFLLVAGNKKEGDYTSLDLFGKLLGKYHEHKYPYYRNRFSKGYREFESILLFSHFKKQWFYERKGDWEKLDRLYQLKYSNEPFSKKRPAVEEALKQLAPGVKLPAKVADNLTLGLFLDELSKNYSFAAEEEMKGRIFPFFWYHSGRGKNHLVFPPLLSWYYRNKKGTHFHSIPLLTFLKRSRQEDWTTILTPIVYYDRERRREKSFYPILPRTTKNAEDYQCAVLQDTYAGCGLYYRGRSGFLVAKEGVDAEIADTFRKELHHLPSSYSGIAATRERISKKWKKNEAWQTKNEVERLKKLLMREELKEEKRKLGIREEEFRKKMEKAKRLAGKLGFSVKDTAFRNRKEAGKTLEEFMEKFTELRYYEDIGSNILFHKEKFYNGDNSWHFLHILAGGEKAGERESTHILHLLYRSRKEGRRSEKVFFPFISSVRDGEDYRISFLWRLFSISRKKEKLGGYLFFIPFGSK